MELDSIKNGWQNLDVKSVIDEEKLQNIIRKRGDSAYNSLKNWETLGLILLILLLPICVVFLYSEKLYVALYFTIPCVLGVVWQGYKVNYLRGIDVMGMPVTEVAPKVANYRKYIQYEICIGLTWFVGWMVLLVMSRDFNGMKSILVSVAIGVILILLMLYMYKKIYVDKIKRIDQSLEELREFEKEN